jgi:hypothetical protein
LKSSFINPAFHQNQVFNVNTTFPAPVHVFIILGNHTWASAVLHFSSVEADSNFVLPLTLRKVHRLGVYEDRSWGEDLHLRGENVKEDGENYTIKSVIICTVGAMLWGWSVFRRVRKIAKSDY